MRAFLLCIIVAVGVTTASGQQDDPGRTKRVLLDSSQQATIQNGFDVATHLFNEMDKVDLGNVANKLVTGVSGFLGAVGPFVGFALSFFSGPSPELELLKKMFTQVELRFDNVDRQFAQLRNAVSFVATQVHFTDLESNINAVQAELKTLSEVTSTAGYTAEAQEFIRTYDRTYESAGIKLYNSIYYGGLASGGLFDEFMKHSLYDRKQTQKFMIGCLNLLMRAASLEMTYAQLKHSPNIAIKKGDWMTRFGNFKTKMLNIDNVIVRHYHTQMITDINDLATQYPKEKLSNTDFATQLYNKLSSKYFWRDWFVLASAPYDHYKMVTHACDYSQHDKNGRTIQVASVDKTKHSDVPVTSLYHLTLYMHPIGHGSHGHNVFRCLDCNKDYDKLPASKTQCSVNAAAGVVCMQHTDIHIRAATSRYHRRYPHGANLAFLFG